MKARTIIVSFVSLVLLVFLYSTSRIAVSASRQDLSVEYRLHVGALPPDMMKIFAGEFKGLLADYLLLEIGSLTGSDRDIAPEEWAKIAQTFGQSLELDPYFEQTYIYVQGILPWDAEMPEKAIELLKISKAHRPWDWRPGYYIGFNYYYFLKDYAKASDVFLETAKIEGAPVLLAVLGGRFALRTGRTQAAISLLESMLDDPQLHEADKKEITQRITALKGVLLLENAVAAYENRHGIYPPSLEALIKEGLLKSLPENPYGDTYFYTEKTGEVFFDELG
jgi:tetratricopeptide (TPR) repeat protein